LYATPTACARLTFPSAVTGLAAVGPSLVEGVVVLTDDKQLSTVGLSVGSAGGLRILDSTVVPRRGSCLAVLPPPPSAPAALGSGVVLVGDKTGDLWAFGQLPQVSQRKRHLLGHTASIVTSLGLACMQQEGDGSSSAPRPLLLTGDRDEKVRVSLWDAPYIVSSYCLGHLRAVSALAALTAPGMTQLFVSAAGDGTLRLWHAPSGTLLHTLYFSLKAGGSGGSSEVEEASNVEFEAAPMPGGLVHRDPDLVFSKKDFSGAGAEGGEEEESDPGVEGPGGARLSSVGADALASGVADGCAGGGSSVAAAAAAAAVGASGVEGEASIPNTAMGIVGPAELSPQVVPTSLQAFVFPHSGRQYLVCFIVGERAVRLISVSSGQAPIPSAAAEDAAPITQRLLACESHLRLKDNAIPLQVVRAAGSSNLFFAATLCQCGSSGGSSSSSSSSSISSSAGGSERWVYRVVALALQEQAESTAAALVEVGGGPEVSGPLAALNAALQAVEVSPLDLHPSRVFHQASNLTRSPIEYDKASFPKLKNPRG
jgi:hypothetical protein